MAFCTATPQCTKTSNENLKENAKHLPESESKGSFRVLQRSLHLIDTFDQKQTAETHISETSVTFQQSIAKEPCKLYLVSKCGVTQLSKIQTSRLWWLVDAHFNVKWLDECGWISIYAFYKCLGWVFWIVFFKVLMVASHEEVFCDPLWRWARILMNHECICPFVGCLCWTKVVCISSRTWL